MRDPLRLNEPDFARLVGLEHSDPSTPGISRRRCGSGWSFQGPDGELVRGRERERCLALAVPPAWADVWICPSESGHIQAVGVDDAGRRQYRYHDRWTEARRLANFDRMARYGPRLASTRRRLERLLADPSDPKLRVTAAMVRLVDASLERIGSRRSVQRQGHHGISTLQGEHLVVDGDRLELAFVGKGGTDRHHVVTDPLLAQAIADLVAADERVWLVHDGPEHIEVSARDANALVKELSGGLMTCKDFRTWGGSAIALEARREGATDVESVDAAAEALGNTRAVARSAYVHPDVLTADHATVEAAFARTRTSVRHDRRERALLALLEARPPLLQRYLFPELAFQAAA